MTKPIAEIQELAQLTTPLQDALDQVTAALDEASAGAIDGLADGLGPIIDELPPDAKALVDAILGDDLDNLQTLADELTQLLQLLDSPLLSITDLKQDADDRAGGGRRPRHRHHRRRQDRRPRLRC